MITETQAQILLSYSITTIDLGVEPDIQDLFLKHPDTFVDRLELILYDKFGSEGLNRAQKSIRKSFNVMLFIKAGMSPLMIKEVFKQDIRNDTLFHERRRCERLVATPEGRKVLLPLVEEFKASFLKRYKKSETKITKDIARLLQVKSRPKPFRVDAAFQRAYFRSSSQFVNLLVSFLLTKCRGRRGSSYRLRKLIFIAYLTKIGLTQTRILQHAGKLCSDSRTISNKYHQYYRLINTDAGKQLILPLEIEFLDYFYDELQMQSKSVEY